MLKGQDPKKRYLIPEELIEHYLLEMLRLLLDNQGSEKTVWNSGTTGGYLFVLPFLVIAVIGAFCDHFPNTFSAPNSLL